MSILYLLIPMAMLIALVAGIAFFLTIRSGQYDDLDGAAHRILMDDDDPRIPGHRPGGKTDVGTSAHPSTERETDDAPPESTRRGHDSGSS